MIDQPGIHDIPVADYHADPAPEPSLSASVAKILLDQSPAHAKAAHPKLTPPDPEEKTRNERPMEIGTVGHKLALGKGADVVEINADAYTTKAAKEARAEAYANGLQPILSCDLERAQKAARAFLLSVDRHPDLDWAFAGTGHSEATILWRDGRVWCRSMADRVRIEDDRVVLVDLKFTAENAHPAAVARRIFQMGYDFSAGFYRRGLAFVAPQARRFSFLLATTETEEPYASSLVTLDEATWQLVEKRCRTAVGLWGKCLASNVWPSYPRAVATADLPAWLEHAWLERELNDELLAGLPDAASLSDIHQKLSKDLSGAC